VSFLGIEPPRGGVGGARGEEESLWRGVVRLGPAVALGRPPSELSVDSPHLLDSWDSPGMLRRRIQATGVLWRSGLGSRHSPRVPGPSAFCAKGCWLTRVKSTHQWVLGEPRPCSGRLVRPSSGSWAPVVEFRCVSGQWPYRGLRHDWPGVDMRSSAPEEKDSRPAPPGC
jgi:hypothetical protein